MTKFQTFYNLCPIRDPKEFLGITEDCDKQNVIVTLGRNTVVIINVSTRKQVRSWSVVEKLSSNVVYDSRSQSYVGVFANRIIRCWDRSVADINKCTKIKFQKNIAALVGGKEDTYVLYCDGECQKLSKAIQTRKEQIKSVHESEVSSVHTFSDATIWRLNSGYHILTYFDLNNSTGDQDLVRIPLEGGAPIRFNLKRKNINASVVGRAVIEGNEAPMLLTIWSDKRLFLLDLSDTTPSEASPGDFISVLSVLNVRNPISIVGISDHFIALYGANDGQENAALILYNTQFKLVKAKQFFKVYFKLSQLWFMGNCLLLSTGQSLSAITYQFSKELLVHMVGTQSSNEFEAQMEHICEEDRLQECLQYKNKELHYTNGVWSPKNKNRDENTFYNNIAESDGKLQIFESVYNFSHSLNDVSKLFLNVEIESEFSNSENVQLMLMCKQNDNWNLADPDLQLIVHQMEQSGASEHEIIGKLLPLLIKMDLIMDTEKCLRRYQNITENNLVTALAYALDKLEAEQSRILVEASTLETDSNGYAAKVNNLLNTVLCCSFNYEAMTQHIHREIEYPKVILLLRYLYMQSNCKGILERPDLELGFFCDSEIKLLRWLCVLISAHFQKLALCRDVHLIELLIKLNKIFAVYKNEVIELEELVAILYNIVNRKRIQKIINYSKWYSIEEVDLY